MSHEATRCRPLGCWVPNHRTRMSISRCSRCGSPAGTFLLKVLPLNDCSVMISATKRANCAENSGFVMIPVDISISH